MKRYLVDGIGKHADCAARLRTLEGGVEDGAVLYAEISLHEGLANSFRPVFAEEAYAAEVHSEDGQANIGHRMCCAEESAVPAHGEHEVRFRADIGLLLYLINLKGCLLKVLQEGLHAGVFP